MALPIPEDIHIIGTTGNRIRNDFCKVEFRLFTSDKSTDSFNGLIGGINSKAIIKQYFR